MAAIETGELVRRAAGGDEAAAAELIVRHEMLVFRTCANLLPAGEDVEAAVQETFLRALRRLASVTEQASFPGWLAAIAVNYCRDRLRRRRLVPFLRLETGDEEDEGNGPIAVLASSDPNPERVSMARQAVERVRRELDRLPRRQREVFALRFFSGLDLEAIACALSLDIGTVKTHLHRAVHRVRAAAEEAMP